ncbi:hypothetical protein GOBAR_AA30455 [Gossypium barbadense]|uniref:Uncharacterized protein n=1 Tax=Gossypium barbadense TaxID=3634 RepID=A0A2P5WGP1_GOSBA|nr:hypothetical protein GOBAR_AA30455 [Gossypium barbadense]
MASKASSSISQTLKRYIKKPWEVTGPCADPEYKNALPKATEYRIRCPATNLQKPIVPTSDPETVFDIKYYAQKTFDVNDFPKVYLTAKVEEDENAAYGTCGKLVCSSFLTFRCLAVNKMLAILT